MFLEEDRRNPPWLVGDTVEVHGLQTRPALNGQCGCLVAHDTGSGRWQLQLADETVLIKPANLRLVISATSAGSHAMTLEISASTPLPASSLTLRRHESEYLALVHVADVLGMPSLYEAVEDELLRGSGISVRLSVFLHYIALSNFFLKTPQT